MLVRENDRSPAIAAPTPRQLAPPPIRGCSLVGNGSGYFPSLCILPGIYGGTPYCLVGLNI